jgi:RNA polymerase sigma-70 factor (ECF subfamily)
MEPYIVTIVKNASLDILRREKRTVLTDEQIEESYEPDINGELEFQRLVSLIRSMPGHYRNVLELKLVLEYSNKEIGKQLHLNESTVSSRISRGRAMLVEQLKKEGYVRE